MNDVKHTSHMIHMIHMFRVDHCGALFALALGFASACGEPASQSQADATPVSGSSQPTPSAQATTGEQVALGAAPIAEADMPVPEPAPAPIADVVPEKAEALELAFVGDVIFGRYRADGFDPIVDPRQDPTLKPFAAMNFALAADLTVGNLETPLVRELPKISPSRAEYRFGASEGMAKHLVDGGFNVLSVANNHHNDQREPGHTETLEILDELGIHAIGQPQPELPALHFETVQVKGWRVAFVAMTTRLNMPLAPAPPHIPFVPTKEIMGELGPALRSARESHDLVIVSLHWGEEYADNPTSRQKRVARELIEGGADLVFGHHPHVLQGIEAHGPGLIAYSMGNFLFENASPVPKLTGVLRVRFEASAGAARPACLSSAEFFPAQMLRKPFHHPVPAKGRAGRNARARLRTLSARLRTPWDPALDADPQDPRAPMRLGTPSQCDVAPPSDADANAGAATQ